MKGVVIFCSVLFIFAGEISADNSVECPGNSNDEITFIPSPVDCSKYYVCVHSEPHEMSCPDGLWFDTELNVCNYPQNVKCGGECKAPWTRPGSSVACYMTSDTNRITGMKFDDAVEFCKIQNGFLAEPRSDFETTSIKQVLETNVNYWIGLSDREEEGDFRWLSDMSELTYSNWEKNEPNNYHGQDCAQLWSRREHRWDDNDCRKTSFKIGFKRYPFAAVCQK